MRRTKAEFRAMLHRLVEVASDGDKEAVTDQLRGAQAAGYIVLLDQLLEGLIEQLKSLS